MSEPIYKVVTELPVEKSLSETKWTLQAAHELLDEQGILRVSPTGCNLTLYGRLVCHCYQDKSHQTTKGNQ